MAKLGRLLLSVCYCRVYLTYYAVMIIIIMIIITITIIIISIIIIVH